MMQTALKYDLEVRENARVELQVPLPTGARVTVFVVQESDDGDLLAAAQSSTGFWDNSFDDEDWNNA